MGYDPRTSSIFRASLPSMYVECREVACAAKRTSNVCTVCSGAEYSDKYAETSGVCINSSLVSTKLVGFASINIWIVSVDDAHLSAVWIGKHPNPSSMYAAVSAPPFFPPAVSANGSCPSAFGDLRRSSISALGGQNGSGPPRFKSICSLTLNGTVFSVGLDRSHLSSWMFETTLKITWSGVSPSASTNVTASTYWSTKI
mmetsp:Transcript_59531/g.145848  ORF Transcript_59531/g.145848 Transcript_59531/m.145848 type:complete len:200 (-) Transcript_59531:1806-2405(-)